MYIINFVIQILKQRQEKKPLKPLLNFIKTKIQL